nr:MAG TPA: hypothetical protein [Caudoviricetes sp.]
MRKRLIDSLFLFLFLGEILCLSLFLLVSSIIIWMLLFRALKTIPSTKILLNGNCSPSEFKSSFVIRRALHIMN